MSIPIRPALPADVRGINRLVEPMTHTGVLLGKDLVSYYEAVQEFLVATDEDGEVVGCGALHVMWEDLGEVRTLLVSDEWLHRGVGRRLVDELEIVATKLGITRLFCLTFETAFFARRGFTEIGEQIVSPDVYSQLVRSPDEGIAEFLDLAHVKPNTLGNTRMLKHLT